MRAPPARALPALLAESCTLYFLLALAGLYLSRQPGNIATLWYANALGVAYLVGQPVARAALLLSGDALVLFLANWCGGDPAPLAAMLVLPNLLEMALAALLLGWTGAAREFYHGPRRFLRFLALGCCLPPLLGASAGATALALNGYAEFARVWPAWYAGAAIGNVGLLPLALLVSQQGGAVGRAIDWPRLGALLSAAIGISLLALSFLPFPFVYIMVTPIIAAVLLSFEGVAALMCLSSMATGIIIATGHFVAPPVSSNWQQLLIYLPILLTMIPPLVLAASTHQARLREQNGRQLEQALKRGNEDLQLIIDHMPAMIGYWDSDLRSRLCNLSYGEWLGCDSSKVNGMHLSEVIGAEPFALNRHYIEAALRGEKVMFERALLDHKGVARELLASFLPDIDNGVVRGFYAFVSDIAPLKKAQQGQLAAQAMVEGIIRAASEFSIISTQNDGTITLFSAGAERMLGYGADEVVGRHSPALIHLADEVAARGRQLSAELGRPMQGFEVFAELGERRDQSVWTYVRKDCSRLPVRLFLTPLRDSAQRQCGFLGIATDITEQLLLQDSLLAAKEQAESASRAKTEFVANMSHEIRTPLNAVLGMAHLLGSTALSPEQRTYADMIRVAGQSLLSILNDILDFSKIEAGRMELVAAPFQLADLLGALADIMTVSAGDKALELAIGVNPGVPAVLIGDALRLQQVLVNLTGNAIKFTAAGEVSLLVDMAPGGPDADADGMTLLTFSIADTGIGMDLAQQASLFEPFAQADSSTTRRFGGTGLGLAICKRLVDMMGGRIEVSSTLGRGSRFRVSVPLKLAPAQERERALRPPALRLLVVDANPTSRDYLCRSIAAGDSRADGAASAAQALAAVDALQADGGRYDAVLADCHLPDMDGAALMGALRAAGGAALPVLLMTSAFGRGRLKLEGQADRPDAVLTKPLTGAALFAAVRAALAQRAAPSGPVGQSPPPAAGARLDGMRLLLVEDNRLNQLVARSVLEMAGAAVQVVGDGRQALDALRASGGAPPFDLVLMDVQMPVMDGFAATRAIRAELGLALPIVAMTAGVMASERAQCAACGMDDFVAKPLDIEQLIAVLTRYRRAPDTSDTPDEGR
ncbi:MAG: response regulator [Pseudomonadota bacterium]